MSEGEFYNIEKILDRRKINGKFEYKIKWEGYPMSQSTWEPMKNLDTAKELVDEYDRLHPLPTKKQSLKSENKKKDSLLNQKRNITKQEIVKDEEENNPNEKIIEEKPQLEEKNNDEEIKQNNKSQENQTENSYIIDDSLKKVITVKQQGLKFLAVVEKMDQNGDIKNVYIPTEELRKSNPWILLNFYESKIKFT